MNKCKTCEFGNYSLGEFNKPVSEDILGHLWSICQIYIECLHWGRPEDPFFIKASGPTPGDCPKEKDEMKSKKEVLEMIAEDMKNDAKEFDGQSFNGRTVGKYFGNQGAAIAALAKIIKSMV